MIKYIEIDSTYRNRVKWPHQSMFVVENTRPTDDDTISTAMPILAWKGGSVATAATVVSSTTTTVIVTGAGLPTALDHLTNAALYPPGIRIASYSYIGANQAEITLATPLATPLAPASAVSVTDPTDLARLRVFVPGVAGVTPSNYYVGMLLYDETTGGRATIVSYNPAVGVVTVDAAIPGWAVSDQFNIRATGPASSGVAGATSTTATVVGPASVQPGAFIRVYPSYPPIAPSGETSRVIAVDTTTSTATVYPRFSASPALKSYEVLPMTGTNSTQMTYSGTTQVECVNSTIRLIHLILPNADLSVGDGGRPTDYPYLHVQLTSRDSSNIHINCSNNPHATHSLFRATRATTDPLVDKLFVKYTGDSAAVRVRFKVDSDLSFRVSLPNGQIIEYVTKDTTSPSVPNPLLQISALFEVTRDGGLGTTYGTVAR